MKIEEKLKLVADIKNNEKTIKKAEAMIEFNPSLSILIESKKRKIKEARRTISRYES